MGTMKQAKILILLMLLVLSSASAQTVSSITIGTTITSGPAPTFYVDGTAYNTTQIFLWPQGSKHTVFFPEDLDLITLVPLGYQSSGYPYFVRWGFSGWSDNQGLLQPSGEALQTITADPSITSFLAGVNIQYQLTI